ncbi:dispanin subfamily A member 2b-like [Gadus chalcogrammus]|uniref:dispanin subfamily A member 2b-like n=1 Tax=Gadus chalcogrammus TaxID=1042646 RepID=UPI0024C4C94A|nr:dispanin subfamily A member 2b-like [Gadus chalcogrammus]
MIKAHCFLHRPTLLHKMEMKEVRSAPPSDYQELQFNRDPDTVVTIVNPVEHPRDYVVWSICSFFHANPFCLGLLALIFSFKARDMKVIGDLQRAREYSKWALGLNVAALIILTLTILSLVIVLIIILIKDNDY